MDAFKKILKIIKKYDNIVISRHIGVDPDALASQTALRDALRLTFPNKKVIAVGTSSAKFNFIGKPDKYEVLDNALLIVLDTPDKKRIDTVDINNYSYCIKMDHHPFIEDFGGVEYIKENASSTCEIVMKFILEMKLKCTREIAEKLFMGLVSDSNRFLFGTCTDETFAVVAKYLEMYKFDLVAIYQKLYARPLSEVRLEGYIALNMVVTKNGLGYIKITDELLNEFGVDSAAAGNMINNFNFINEVLVWVTLTEDVKNNQIRVSIRSRGPEINKIAEKYHGGGHKAASGARFKTFLECQDLLDDLDKYLEEVSNGN